MLLEIHIYMPLFSKARPRVAGGRAYMPPEYKAKINEMRGIMKEAYKGVPLEGPLDLGVHVEGHARGDLDNIVGALLDAGKDIIWVDDRVSVIRSIACSWKKAPTKGSVWKLTVSKPGKRGH